MARINFKKASRVDEEKTEKFFSGTPDGSRRPAPPKKVRVFLDLAPDELQKLDRLVMERQLAGGKVVYRSVVARELLLEALESCFRAQDAE